MPVRGDYLDGVVSTSIRDHLGNCDVTHTTAHNRGVWDRDNIALGGEHGITGYLHKLTVCDVDFPGLRQGDAVSVVVDHRPNDGGHYVVSELRRANGSIYMMLSRG